MNLTDLAKKAILDGNLSIDEIKYIKAVNEDVNNEFIFCREMLCYVRPSVEEAFTKNKEDLMNGLQIKKHNHFDQKVFLNFFKAYFETDHQKLHEYMTLMRESIRVCSSFDVSLEANCGITEMLMDNVLESFQCSPLNVSPEAMGAAVGKMIQCITHPLSPEQFKLNKYGRMVRQGLNTGAVNGLYENFEPFYQANRLLQNNSLVIESASFDNIVNLLRSSSVSTIQEVVGRYHSELGDLSLLCANGVYSIERGQDHSIITEKEWLSWSISIAKADLEGGFKGGLVALFTPHLISMFRTTVGEQSLTVHVDSKEVVMPVSFEIDEVFCARLKKEMDAKKDWYLESDKKGFWLVEEEQKVKITDSRFYMLCFGVLNGLNLDTESGQEKYLKKIPLSFFNDENVLNSFENTKYMYQKKESPLATWRRKKKNIPMSKNEKAKLATLEANKEYKEESKRIQERGRILKGSPPAVGAAQNTIVFSMLYGRSSLLKENAYYSNLKARRFIEKRTVSSLSFTKNAINQRLGICKKVLGEIGVFSLKDKFFDGYQVLEKSIFDEFKNKKERIELRDRFLTKDVVFQKKSIGFAL